VGIYFQTRPKATLLTGSLLTAIAF